MNEQSDIDQRILEIRQATLTHRSLPAIAHAPNKWPMAAAVSLFAVCVLAPAATLGQANGNAPADRYFGRLKLSFLGINNTFRHADIRIGEGHTTDSHVINKVDFAVEALNDWQNKYPHDTHLPRSYFLGQRTLKKVWIKRYQDKAWAYMQRLVTAYPATFFGKTVKAELARGFTQHYFSYPHPCDSHPVEPTRSVTASNGKYRVQVYYPPCKPATPSPAPAIPSLAPAIPVATATPAPAATPSPTRPAAATFPRHQNAGRSV